MPRLPARAIRSSSIHIGEFDAYARTFMEVWDTFEITPLSPEPKKERKLVSLAARCGTEVEK